VDERIADQAVVLKRRHGVNSPDVLIAATALLENARLVTRDQALLDKVPGVESLNPFGRM
jgi:predicted nucleic acid-binding protein